MRIVMAVSKDGYVARGPSDDMSWLGATDKAVFRILTGVNGDVAVGRGTACYMPRELPGRSLVYLSSRGRQTGKSWGTLEQFHRLAKHGWLIGGPRLALLALEAGYVDEVHLCRSDRCAFPDTHEDDPIVDPITPWLTDHLCTALPTSSGWVLELETRLLDVTVECWRHRGD